MGKGEFKVRNINKLTTEQVKGLPLNYKEDDNNLGVLGIMTHADENYLYGKFTHTGEEYVRIEIGCDKDVYSGVIFSMEIEGE